MRDTRRFPVAPPITAESIAAAKRAQQRERQVVQARTGIQFRGDVMIHPAIIVHCPRPGCSFSATARTDGRTVQALATHLVIGHMQERTHG